MSFVVLLPLLLWCGLYVLAPDHPWLLTLAEPLPVVLSAGVVAVLAGLMRQWHWWYWLGLALASWWGTQQALTVGAFQDGGQGLLFFQLVLAAILCLLLAWLSKPPLWTRDGALWMAGLVALPLLLPRLPLAAWFGALPWLPSLPMMTVLALTVAIAGAVAVLLLLRLPDKPQYWGQLSASLMLMLSLLTAPQYLLSSAAMAALALSIFLALILQMLHLAYIDELTQLPQRRALMADLRRLGKRSAVTMLDVDHFKSFNDTYGHDVGDQVLRLLGAIFSRQSGFRAYRYGGEEFTFVFSHNDRTRIEAALEAVREEVARYPLRIRSSTRPKNTKKGAQQRGQGSGKVVHITISLGCALRRSGESTTALLKRADTILYSAKKAGRNRVMLKS